MFQFILLSTSSFADKLEHWPTGTFCISLLAKKLVLGKRISTQCSSSSNFNLNLNLNLDLSWFDHTQPCTNGSISTQINSLGNLNAVITFERKRRHLEWIPRFPVVCLHWSESDFAWKLGCNPFWSDIASDISLSLSLQYNCTLRWHHNSVGINLGNHTSFLLLQIDLLVMINERIAAVFSSKGGGFVCTNERCQNNNRQNVFRAEKTYFEKQIMKKVADPGFFRVSWIMGCAKDVIRLLFHVNKTTFHWHSKAYRPRFISPIPAGQVGGDCFLTGPSRLVLPDWFFLVGGFRVESHPKIVFNKTVLLRECKRRPARSVLAGVGGVE